MVISIIITLFKTGLFAVLLDDYFKRNYPEKYNDLLIQCSFTVIYVYSNCQIQVNNILNKLQIFINTSPKLVEMINKYQNKDKVNDIDFIYDNQVVFKTRRSTLLNNINNLQLPEKFDFLIFSEYKSQPNTSCIINKYITYFLPTDLEPSYFLCETSNIKFILSEIVVNNDIKIKINFVQNTDNYYIVNNIFDNKFMQYFLYKYYKKDLEELNIDNLNDYDYTLEIIDHNVNKTSINFKTSKIKIEKDSYEILKLEI